MGIGIAGTFLLVTQLSSLWQQGHSTAEIGRRLGISKNAVVGKAHRLSLDPRPSPLKRPPAPRVVGIIGPTCSWPHGHPGEKDFHFNVFQHQKWTPYLMMMTLFNSLSGDNEFKDEATYRLSGTVEMEGRNLSLNTMQSSGEMPMPVSETRKRTAGWPAVALGDWKSSTSSACKPISP